MTAVLIGLTRLPRIILLGAIALSFGISIETDTFFLIYSIALFLTATVSYSTEVLAPGVKTFVLGVLVSIIILLGTFLFTGNTIALLFIAYVILSSIASSSTGIINREQNYKLLGLSVIPYLLATLVVLYVPKDIFVLTLVLSIAELVRTTVTFKYIGKVLVIKQSSPYSLASFMLFAVILGGCIPVILKLFALGIGPGTVSILAYTLGVVFPISNAFSYGVSIDKINRISSKVSLVPSIIMAIFLMLGSLLVYYTPFWIKELSIPIAIFSIFIPLSTLSAIKRAYLIKAGSKGTFLKASCLYLISVVTLSFILQPYGVIGLLISLLAGQMLHLFYLIYSLRQQNYFSYHSINKDIILESD